MSKSSEEIINMPIASISNTASETSTPTLLRGILRTASTADSSRRVTWSPMPINATTANDDVLYTNTKRNKNKNTTNKNKKRSTTQKKFLQSNSSSSNTSKHQKRKKKKKKKSPPPPPGSPPPVYLDIPSDLEMSKRAMSRGSEFRMLMGTKTGSERDTLKKKRRMSTLQAAARAVGRMKMAAKREVKKTERAHQRRNSLIGQFATSNL